MANVRCSVQDVVPKSEQTKDLRRLSLARKQENRKWREGGGGSSCPLACIRLHRELMLSFKLMLRRILYRVAHLLRERDMLTPNLKLRLAVKLSCDLGR